MTLTRIPPEFEVRYRQNLVYTTESSADGWTAADAIARAHELMSEGARGIRILRRRRGGCECDWRLYLRVGPVWCGLRRLFLGFRCGSPAGTSRAHRRAVRRDAIRYPGGCA